jgi:hypothetical protein
LRREGKGRGDDEGKERWALRRKRGGVIRVSRINERRKNDAPLSPKERFGAIFDRHVGWWIFGRNLSLGVEPRVLDDAFGGYPVGIGGLGKKIGTHQSCPTPAAVN